jgi:hypothetical protein
MSFLERLNEVSKQKTFEAKFDFGKGDGEETLTFKALNYNDRKRVIANRMVKIGQDKDGNDKWGIEVQKEGLEFSADLLASSWIRPDGRPVASRTELMQWDGDLLDQLTEICRDAIGLFKNTDKAKDENPSTPQS